MTPQAFDLSPQLPFRMWHAASICLLFVGCTGLSFHPAPVVPTKHQLPYSVQLRLIDLATYAVEPGSTLRSDPQLHNYVVHTGSTPSLSVKQWEKAVLDYVTARQTFRKVVEHGASDIGMVLRIFVYIDPGVGFKFNHTYVVRADATVIEPHTGRVITHYSGFGKAFGPVSRGAKEDDESPISKSVQAALNDLFSKIETDKRFASL
jgi:hypothetical protein